MTTMMNPHTHNSRKRPSLSEQIDRLDSVLDGLAENLNDAVADAVKVAVGTAVQHALESVLKDVLTNPVVVARLQVPATEVTAPAVTPAVPDTIADRPLPVSLWQRIGACAAVVGKVCKRPFQSAWSLTKSMMHRACNGCLAVWAHRDLLGVFKYQLLSAATIGVLLAVLACYSAPWLAAAISGVGGFLTALAVQAGLWMRKLLTTTHEQFA